MGRPADGDLTRLLGSVDRAAQEVRLLDAATPLNVDAETARLVGVRRRGGRDEPAFAYAPRPEAAALADAVASLAGALWSLGPHAGPFAARADEIALEASLVAARGTPAFRLIACRRYASSPADDARARRWARLEPEEETATRGRSDNEGDPGSLVSTMRREVGRRRLAVRVVTRAAMASLAAAGEGVVFVAAGRWVTPRDVARTVLHELDGHVVPALARSGPWPRATRPAADADGEEGRALALEARHGFLDAGRKKELGLRHLAARAAHEGAGFHDVVDLLEGLGAEQARAVALAARALRGGGLGRERVYLPMLRRAQQRVAPRP